MKTKKNEGPGGSGPVRVCDIDAQQKGREREMCVHHVLETLKNVGWLHGFVPSGKWSRSDVNDGIDIFVTKAGASRYEDFPLSITGPFMLRSHQERHPEVPNIIVDLETNREVRVASVAVQVIATLSLERLKRSGKILDYSLDGELVRVGVRYISFSVVLPNGSVRRRSFTTRRWLREQRGRWTGPCYVIEPKTLLAAAVVDSEILSVILQLG